MNKYIQLIVVKLTENAFVDKEGYSEELKSEIPGMRISVMDGVSENNP